MVPEFTIDLGRLQHHQERHDRRFHADIYALPRNRRLTHLVLHFIKYLGCIALGPERSPPAFVRALLDIVLIALSAANALGLPLATYDFCRKIPHAHPRFWLRDAMLLHTASLAKACEDYDHGVTENFEEIFIKQVTHLLQFGLLGLRGFFHFSDQEIVQLIQERWTEVEARSI